MKLKLSSVSTVLALFSTSAVGQPVANQLAARILAVHNAQRATYGLPPLVWDPVLAAGAAVWAQQMSVTGVFQHSDRKARPGVGENMWYGTRGAYSVEAMIGLWVNEKRNFVAGVFPNVSRTGNWFDVSHYTQMIWPTTQRIGCAIGSNARVDYLVCRYSPKGNVDGKLVGYRAAVPIR